MFADRAQRNSTYKSKYERINQPIRIWDITVESNPKMPYGESDFDIFPKEREESVERLAFHIMDLANIANSYHRNLNGDNDKSNNIIRLSTKEYDLFTADPISQSDFLALIEVLEDMCSKMHPNIHLVLNTFAVKGDHGEITNTSLYLRGGEGDCVMCLSKPLVNVEGSKANVPSYDNEPQYVKSSDACLKYNTVFVVTTAGGAQYLQAVEVDENSLNRHYQNIVDSSSHDDSSSDPVSLQVDHLIISRSVEKKVAVIEDKEPRHHASKQSSDIEKDKVKVSAGDISKALNTRSVSENSGIIKVESTKFGSHFTIIPNVMRKLNGFSSQLKKKLDMWNNQISHHEANVSSEAKIKVGDKKEKNQMTEMVVHNLNEMIDKIEPLCQYNFFELLFSYGRYTTYRYLKDAIKLVEIGQKKKMDLSEITLPILSSLYNSLSDAAGLHPRKCHVDALKVIKDTHNSIIKNISKNSTMNKSR